MRRSVNMARQMYCAKFREIPHHSPVINSNALRSVWRSHKNIMDIIYCEQLLLLHSRRSGLSAVHSNAKAISWYMMVERRGAARIFARAISGGHAMMTSCNNFPLATNRGQVCRRDEIVETGGVANAHIFSRGALAKDVWKPFGGQRKYVGRTI